MVRRRGQLGGVRLGRADIHAAVYLHRVAGDDLAAQAARQLDAEPGLARGRGAGDNGYFGGHFQTPSLPLILWCKLWWKN